MPIPTGNFQAPRDDWSPVRRALRAVGIIALGLALGSAALWKLWLPHWRPDLRDGERYAIDVSSHQGEIDWSAVAGDGIDAGVERPQSDGWR